MSLESAEPDLVSKRVQYEILQSRIALHGGRMWQLPLTYLGMLAISLTVVNTENSNVPFNTCF